MTYKIKIAGFAVFLFIGVLVFAGECEDLLKQAEQCTSLEQRMNLWLKAVEKAQSAQQKESICQQGFSLSLKIHHEKMTSAFAEKLRDCASTSAQKASATYQYLLHKRDDNKQPSATTDDWEAYLAMPEKQTNDELDAMRRLANLYHRTDDWYKEADLLRQLLRDPRIGDFMKQDVLLNLSQLLITMNEMDESMDCMKKLLDMKTLSPARRARSYLLMGDTMKKGCGWYYLPNPAQYKELLAIYRKALTVKKGNIGMEPYRKLIDAAWNQGNMQEVIHLSHEIVSKKGIERATWCYVKEKEGQAHMALEEFDEAVEIFELLYKYKFDLANTCMSLGQAYYRHKDYLMALAMYDEALVELGRADDARPAICKHWCNRLKWFSGGKERLDKIYAAHAKRLNAEAAAQGKGPVAKIQEVDELRPFDDGKRKPKQKPKNLQELMKDEEENILDNGLDLSI